MKKKTAKKSSTLLIYAIAAFAVLVVGTFFLKGSQVPSKAHECANSISCAKNLSGDYEDKSRLGEYMGKLYPVEDSHRLAKTNEKRYVLGDTTAVKRIYVDLNQQHLYAKEDDTTVMDFPVSTGKWNRTPTGIFRIWIKLRYTRMAGGNRAIGTYYNLPNVPYTMFFYNDVVSKSDGYSIHGTYWHNNFGHPMSHGCVNMKIEDVEKLYAWAYPQTLGNTTYATKDNPGTEVIIYGTAPNE